MGKFGQKMANGWLLFQALHCSYWMDTEECLRRRREQYRHRRDRETPEEVERRRRRNREYLRCERAAMSVEQRRLMRTRNVQVSTSTWDLVCIVIRSLTWMSYLSWQALLEYHWDYFLCFEQQQRGSAHWYALSLINCGDASYSEDEDK